MTVRWPKPARPAPVKRQPRAPRKVLTHVFLNGGQVDHAGVPICEDCGHLRPAKVHDLTVLSEDVAVIEARRIGEGGDVA